MWCSLTEWWLSLISHYIQLLESPIPAPAAAAPSQKASSDNISGTKRGTVDPLEKILNKKIKKKT